MIGKLKPPDLFKEHIDDESRNLLDESLYKDIAWAMAGGVKQDVIDVSQPLPLQGSWTAFKKGVTDVKFDQSIITYLPTIPDPPEYNVCKEYLDSLKDAQGVLE